MSSDAPLYVQMNCMSRMTVLVFVCAPWFVSCVCDVMLCFVTVMFVMLGHDVT